MRAAIRILAANNLLELAAVVCGPRRTRGVQNVRYASNRTAGWPPRRWRAGLHLQGLRSTRGRGVQSTPGQQRIYSADDCIS